MKKETLATGGVLGLSFLIASCCIGPTLFLMLGVSVGALGVFSVLEPYQPYFIGAGVLALGFAGHRIFRPAELATDADGACARTREAAGSRAGSSSWPWGSSRSRLPILTFSTRFCRRLQ